MESLRPRLRTWLVAAGALILIVAAFRIARSLRPPDPAAMVRDSIVVLRASADSCMSAVDSGAAAMRAYGRTLDSMRTRVREMEALDQRGVPVDSFDIYMAAFNAYNDSVGMWPAREDSLRAHDALCRQIALRHNLLTDSLRALIMTTTRD